MRFKAICVAIGVIALLLTTAGSSPNTPPDSGPEYTGNGELRMPEHYRDWVYLTSGFDMSYNPGARSGDNHNFDNVFVNPQAYRAFLDRGTWPDGTMLALEVRHAQSRGSINQAGSFQSQEVAAVELHVKDSK